MTARIRGKNCRKANRLANRIDRNTKALQVATRQLYRLNKRNEKEAGKLL